MYRDILGIPRMGDSENSKLGWGRFVASEGGDMSKQSRINLYFWSGREQITAFSSSGRGRGKEKLVSLYYEGVGLVIGGEPFLYARK